MNIVLQYCHDVASPVSRIFIAVLVQPLLIPMLPCSRKDSESFKNGHHKGETGTELNTKHRSRSEIYNLHWEAGSNSSSHDLVHLSEIVI
jgi:hypothetical protein